MTVAATAPGGPNQAQRRPKHIFVVGAGAKAVALACHAAVLHRLGHPRAPFVTVVERNEIGHTWAAGAGFSDGKQRLCTSPEHDLGFPYRTGNPALGSMKPEREAPEPQENDDLEIWQDGHELFPAVAETMLAEFSFQSFLLAESAFGIGYAKWVVAGRPAFTHERFKAYLTWAMFKAIAIGEEQGGAPIRLLLASTVEKIESCEAGWRVRLKAGSGPRTIRADGVVVTGNGPPRRGKVARSAEHLDPGSRARFLDAPAFWTDGLATVKAAIADRAGPDSISYGGEVHGARIAVIGGGGGAVAICRRILEISPSAQIVIFGKSGALHVRSSNAFELRPYIDPDYWGRLPLKERRKFNRRLSGGVAWSEIADEVGGAEHVEFSFGMVEGVEPVPFEMLDSSTDVRLAVVCRDGELTLAPGDNCFDLVVDAGGYGFRTHVAGLLDGKRLLDAFGSAFRSEEEDDPTLVSDPKPAFELAEVAALFPGLHLPDLCALSGPAATNLLALGWLATSILQVHAKTM